jgi:uncharacterized iron-regulated membrane protein
MTKAATIRAWFLVHKWTSLICTLFLLVICLTGLPLIFNEEIGDWLDDSLPYAAVPADAPRADLDRLVATARQLNPGEIVTTIFIDDDEPQVVVSLAPSWDVANNDPTHVNWIKFDAHTGQILKQSVPLAQRNRDVMDIVLSLHQDLFMGLPGNLFLGTMALLFVAAIVSGIVLYGRFMRRLDFGTVRRQRTRRVKWLDLHNLLGVVTLAWALVVGATGVMNELSLPLFMLFERNDVQAILAPWQGKAPPAPNELASVQKALDTARRALPGMEVVSILFPGDRFGTPHHYMLWAKGDTPLTGQLFSPVLIDAQSGALTTVLDMPWYLRALELSRPLHFGNYGGLPLKIIWALLALITIGVLASGVYLWLSRRRSPIETFIAEIERGGEVAGAALPLRAAE